MGKKVEEVQEIKWNFTREWEIVFNTVSGRSYKDTVKQPVDWNAFYVEQETKERILEMRVISTDEWEIFTEHIEGFKVEKRGLIKSCYPDHKHQPASKEDLEEAGYPPERIKDILG
jgi:hypothetical protein